MGIIVDRLIIDRLYGFFHRNQLKETFKNLGKPQVNVYTIRSNDDILKHAKRLNASNGLYVGEFLQSGSDDKVSTILDMQKMEPSKFKEIAGNVRLIHIENNDTYSCSVCSIQDANKCNVSFRCDQLAYLEKGASITCLLNAYNGISKISIDYNGHKLGYIIADRDGSIEPIVE